MPRKKQTRTASRKKPQVPKGDDGHDLSEEERKEKLRLFLKDFETQVETNVNKLKKDMMSVMELIEKLVNCHLFNLPQVVREMSVRDFLEAGGTVDQALSSLNKNEDDLFEDPIDLCRPKSAKLSKRIMANCYTVNAHCQTAQLLEMLSQRIRPGPESIACETIQEENETPMNSTKSTTGRPKRAVKRKMYLEEKQAPSLPPSAYKSKNLRTPHYKSLVSSGWETPLVTPKFDPRLPMTPGQGRDPKPGERIMSLQGSPLNNVMATDRNTVQFLVKGRAVPVNKVTDDPSALDDLGIEQIHHMMEILTEVYNKSKTGHK